MCKPSELGPVLKGCSQDRDVVFERRHLSQSMRASFEAVGGKRAYWDLLVNLLGGNQIGSPFYIILQKKQDK